MPTRIAVVALKKDFVACLSGLAAAAKVAIYGTPAAGGTRCERDVPVPTPSAAADMRAKGNAAMVFQKLLEFELLNKFIVAA